MASDSSLSNVTSSETSRVRLSTTNWQARAEAAKAGEDNSLWLSTRSIWSSINSRYSKGQSPADAIEINLHDLWFMYYQAAINVSSTSSDQDTLAFQVLQAREQGALVRWDPDGATTARTTDGRIWTDLRFLASDMINFWNHDFATLSAIQRLNFASFLAKFASVSLEENKFSCIALIVLRDILETPWLLGQLDEQETEGKHGNRTIVDLSTAALLPAATPWLFYTVFKIVQLADMSWNDCP